MNKIKKIHKIIILFIVIFLLGIYSFSVYINKTMSQKKEPIDQTNINSPIPQPSDRKATQIH